MEKDDNSKDNNSEQDSEKDRHEKWVKNRGFMI
jgi:hypothetical protein